MNQNSDIMVSKVSLIFNSGCGEYKAKFELQCPQEFTAYPMWHREKMMPVNLKLPKFYFVLDRSEDGTHYIFHKPANETYCRTSDEKHYIYFDVTIFGYLMDDGTYMIKGHTVSGFQIYDDRNDLLREGDFIYDEITQFLQTNLTRVDYDVNRFKRVDVLPEKDKVHSSQLKIDTNKSGTFNVRQINSVLLYFKK